MVNYKLVKTYPGSPELGTIVNKSYIKNSNRDFTCIDITNSPEYWEKVEEKDYEILSFTNIKSKDIVYAKNGMCSIPGYKKDTIENVIKSLSYINACIHSVKRLSDGEIFTIGDKVKQSNVIHNNTFTITGFEFDVNKEHLLAIGNGGIKISKIEKVKPVLFYTEDGVDIYEGDEIHIFYLDTFQINSYKKGWLKSWRPLKRELVFSTKEAAEEYAILNKPCLSINDVATVYVTANKYNEDTPYNQPGQLRQLVKNKLKL